MTLFAKTFVLRASHCMTFIYHIYCSYQTRGGNKKDFIAFEPKVVE